MYNFRACARLAVKFQKLTSITNHQSKREIKRYVAPTLRELTKRQKKQENPIVNPRSKYLDWNRNAELYAFNQRLTEKFDLELLEQAFTHRSYVIQEEEEQKKVGIEDPQLDILDNRELVEEGKQIAPLIIDNYLSQVLPLAPLECIDALREYLLSPEILAKTASGIGSTDLILSTDFPVEGKTLANTFYALISALNRSVDLEHTSVFVRDILIARLVEKDLMEIWCPEEPLEILNDILDREHRELAEPRIIAQTGANTVTPVYQIGIYSNRELLGTGFGETIEEAQNIAALKSLMGLFGLLDCSPPIRCDKKMSDSVAKNMPLKEWSRSN
ncbi:39S ribosomal protein L44, mitochondrial [Copidosoma floridanum]|uniref:39S ribosomal protein L44, mitochondrial n=1 Tax=Copidosoma floridanum TaxID=29053 RepID=UPI0006C99742|nr:39S ribosomal protein L44, mitochondrial [Copidosoma floridanum]